MGDVSKRGRMVLSRRPGQKVILDTADGSVLVEVLHVRRDGRVKLGFTAPRQIPVDRLEVHERKRRAREEAAAVQGADAAAPDQAGSAGLPA